MGSDALAVRCLGCGSVYLKPADGTEPAGAHACPSCDYVGWVPAGELRREPEPPRPHADPLLHPPRRRG